MASGLELPSSRPVATPRRTTPEPTYCNVEPNGRLRSHITDQPTYTNNSVSLANTTMGGMSTTQAEMGFSPSAMGSHSNGRMKQMEQEIHLLRMSVNDKDAQLAQVHRDLTYSHDQIKQLNVLLAEKKESILTYQERISDMHTEIVDLRQASVNAVREPHPDIREARQANEALQLQMNQLRAQLADINQQNTDLRAQNRDLSWQVQQLKQQQQQRPPLRATGSEDNTALHRQSGSQREHQLAETLRENQTLRSRVEILTHQVATYDEDFRAERSDRERAQTKIQEQKEEISGFKQMIVILARDHGIQLNAYGLGHLADQLQ